MTMRMRLIAPAATALMLATPSFAQAQDASGHQHDHPAEPETEPAPMDHSTMDHSTMDHSKMDHAAMGHTPAPAATSAPAPLKIPAFRRTPTSTGQINAADAIWGSDALRSARHRMFAEHGGHTMFWFQADRMEARMHGGADGFLWDVQGYYGTDLHKFWFKSEGEGEFGHGVEDAEVQALYSTAISPFLDFQSGIRQDLTGPSRTYAVIGVQGVAPYMLELDSALFLSTKGDLTARVEAEYDQRITQRLILQPRVEASLSAQNIPELGLGSGLTAFEGGLRLRYEFSPEFAPYIGVEQEWKSGRTRQYALANGQDPSVTSIVAGIRFWF